MMNCIKRISILTVVSLLCIFSTEEIFGQDLTGLLEKINALELSLQRVEKQVNHKIELLQKEITPANVNTIEGDFDIQKAIAVLNVRINQLAANLEQLNSYQAQAVQAELSDAQQLNSQAFFEALLAMDEEIIEPEDEQIEGDISDLALNSSLGAQPSLEFAPIDITGFGDFSRATRQEQGAKNSFELGQVEIDLETNLGDQVVIAAALAYDEAVFGLGAFTIDFHLFGSDDSHFRRVKGIEHSGIMVGQFDVPFGIDWQVYPSPDRKLVSSPLVVENTHDSWNDYGLQGYLETERINAVVYGTNGFGYEGADAFGNTVEFEMNTSVGGRIGIKPYNTIEIGGSYSSFSGDKSKVDMTLLGMDLQLNFKNLSLKGEYITQRYGIARNSTQRNSGLYGQGLYDFGKFFLTSRYGLFSSGAADVDNLKRLSVGGGWVLFQNCELRLEHQINSQAHDDITIMQLVVGF